MKMDIEEKGLIIPLPATALEVFKPGGVDPILSAIENEVKKHVPDLTTVKGRSEIASLAHKVAKSKTYLDGLGKDLVAEWKKKSASVDAERKRMRDTLDALKEEARKPLTEWEVEEERRVAMVRGSIQEFHEAAAARYEDSASITHALKSVNAVVVDGSFGELAGEATMAKDYAVKVLEDILVKQLMYEADQAELARLRKAEEDRKAKEEEENRLREEQERKAREEKERQEREERIRREAEEAAKKREAQLLADKERVEREAKEAAERAEVEKAEAEKRAAEEKERAVREAEDRAKAEAARVERERLAREESERKEAERKAANLNHRRGINRAAKSSLVSLGLSGEMAEKVVASIASGLVKHVSITY